MEPVSNHRVLLDESAHDIFRKLADPDAPNVMTLEQMRAYAAQAKARPASQSNGSLTSMLIDDVLAEAESLMGIRSGGSNTAQ